MAPKRSATASGAVPKRKRKMLTIAEKTMKSRSRDDIFKLLTKTLHV